ncbi:MAG: dGTP triphosphohydrolase [Opitutales bacterium]
MAASTPTVMPEAFYCDFDTATFEDGGPGRGREADTRSPFQIDRDRVVFAYPFRALQSKTQVFQTGEYDFYRTRLTHSLEVARIGRSLCEALRQQNPAVTLDADLVEAICLAHDLGHPPFGHIGERKLNTLMADFGGYEGNAQTARILTHLIYRRRNGQPRGMSPTRAFLDGVLKYKRLRGECAEACPEHHFLYDGQAALRAFVCGDAVQPRDEAHLARSLECQVMDWADDTAYSLHDIMDGIEAGFLTLERLGQWHAAAQSGDQPLAPEEELWFDKLIGLIERDSVVPALSAKIGDFIRAVRLEPRDHPLTPRSQRYRWQLTVDPKVARECRLYQRIALELIFKSPGIQQTEFKGGFILERLFQALAEHYLGDSSKTDRLALLPAAETAFIHAAGDDSSDRARRLCDCVASLTDRMAIRTYRRLFDPDFGSITDLL